MVHETSSSQDCLCVLESLDIRSKRSLVHLCTSSTLEIAVQCVIPGLLNNTYHNQSLMHRSVSDISVRTKLMRADTSALLPYLIGQVTARVERARGDRQGRVCNS